MNWAILIPIIAQYGLPLAEQLWQLFASGKSPSAEDWANLRVLASQSAQDRMRAALVRANVPLESAAAQALLAQAA